jgi:hypothetical protein
LNVVDGDVSECISQCLHVSSGGCGGRIILSGASCGLDGGSFLRGGFSFRGGCHFGGKFDTEEFSEVIGLQIAAFCGGEFFFEVFCGDGVSDQFQMVDAAQLKQELRFVIEADSDGIEDCCDMFAAAGGIRAAAGHFQIVGGREEACFGAGQLLHDATGELSGEQIGDRTITEIGNAARQSVVVVLPVDEVVAPCPAPECRGNTASCESDRLGLSTSFLATFSAALAALRNFVATGT